MWGGGRLPAFVALNMGCRSESGGWRWPMRSEERQIRRGGRKGDGRPGDAERGLDHERRESADGL